MEGSSSNPNKDMRKLLLLFALLLSACAKYEDGPWLVFSAKAERLAGNWQVEQAFDLDGNNYFLLFKGQSYTFEKDGKLNIRFQTTDSMETVSGSWEFRDQKETLQWLLDADSTRLDTLHFPYDSLASFDILKLTGDELRLIDKNNWRLYFGH